MKLRTEVRDKNVSDCYCQPTYFKYDLINLQFIY